MSFDDNIGYKRDLPLVAYMDFETTAPIDNCFNPEPKSMFVVSYVIIFVFHPKLNLDCIVVQRSFGHSYKKINHSGLLDQWSNGMNKHKIS